MFIEHGFVDNRFNAQHDSGEQRIHRLVDILTSCSTRLKQRQSALTQYNTGLATTAAQSKS